MAEQFEREEEKTPVFVINGFLEAGKTQFLRFTMEQSYFQTEGKTLLLVCEEGEEEYPEALLKKYNTAAIYFESQEECTKEALRALGEEFHPERVLIEWNGLWRQDSLELPEEWFLNQQISIFDTSTLDLYLKNMRAYLGPMLNATELIICNRADEIPEEKLGNYHLSLKAMAPDAEIVFEGRDGEIRGDFSIELPYDLKADKLELTPEMFAIFYIGPPREVRRQGSQFHGGTHAPEGRARGYSDSGQKGDDLLRGGHSFLRSALPLCGRSEL